MTNEEKEKAKEIARLKRIDENTKYEHPFQLEVYERCLDMAAWKDEQFAKEKERIVLEICEKITDQAKDDYKFLKKQKKEIIEKLEKLIEEAEIPHEKAIYIIEGLEKAMKGE